MASSFALDPTTALQAAARPRAPNAPPPRLLVAGAGGPLGREVLKEALAHGRYASVGVLTRAPLQAGVRRLRAVPFGDGADLPANDIAVVVFDRGRDHYGRDEAYHLPEPQALPALATRLRASGVHTLVVVCPIAPALLPQALQHGLANLDEQAVAALGFERLLFVRPTQDAVAVTLTTWPQRLARWMLSQLRYMIPQQERPLRAGAVAAFVFEVLRQWRDAAPGTRVAAAPLLWAAAQKEGPEPVVRVWLHGDATLPLPPGEPAPG
ncbi:hypothetical protein [Methylibium sp. Root1272]|uniref:hypothetical protein n=1 Tax=Methylibium sp. Root1272 TaxID=1736441 RepID=UPI0012E77BAA|nr:hypothetical protein [Methylibium sp. Root1272]